MAQKKLVEIQKKIESVQMVVCLLMGNLLGFVGSTESDRNILSFLLNFVPRFHFDPQLEFLVTMAAFLFSLAAIVYFLELFRKYILLYILRKTFRGTDFEEGTFYLKYLLIGMCVTVFLT